MISTYIKSKDFQLQALTVINNKHVTIQQVLAAVENDTTCAVTVGMINVGMTPPKFWPKLFNVIEFYWNGRLFGETDLLRYEYGVS